MSDMKTYGEVALSDVHLPVITDVCIKEMTEYLGALMDKALSAGVEKDFLYGGDYADMHTRTSDDLFVLRQEVRKAIEVNSANA